MRRIEVLVGASVLLVACGGKAPAPIASASGTDVMHQVWDGGHSTDGTCSAVKACMEPKRGVACTEPPQVGVVQIIETPCLEGAKTWRIGQRSSNGSCAITEVTCADGRACDRSVRDVACPKPIDDVLRVAEPQTEPESPHADYSVSAVKNVEKGQAALAAHELDKAQEYFAFAVDRFPYSKYAHDAELGLLDVELARKDNVDETASKYCVFIEHHPFHPAVTSGDVACRVETALKRPCDRKNIRSSHCSPAAYCSSPAGESRPECRK